MLSHFWDVLHPKQLQSIQWKLELCNLKKKTLISYLSLLFLILVSTIAWFYIQIYCLACPLFLQLQPSFWCSSATSVTENTESLRPYLLSVLQRLPSHLSSTQKVHDRRWTLCDISSVHCQFWCWNNPSLSLKLPWNKIYFLFVCLSVCMPLASESVQDNVGRSSLYLSSIPTVATHTWIHPHTHICTYACWHIHTRTHVFTHTHTNIYSHMYSYTPTDTHTDKKTCIQTHTQIKHTHTYTCIHTNTHTQTHVPWWAQVSIVLLERYLMARSYFLSSWQGMG